MKVKKLIKILEKLNPELEVILQEDAEGNSYSPLCEVEGNSVYDAETSYSGEAYDKNWTYDQGGFETIEEWDEFKKETPDCVVLVPTN